MYKSPIDINPILCYTINNGTPQNHPRKVVSFMATNWIKKDLLTDLVGAVTPSDISTHYNLSWRASLIILPVLVFERKMKITKDGFVGV